MGGGKIRQKFFILFIITIRNKKKKEKQNKNPAKQNFLHPSLSPPLFDPSFSPSIIIRPDPFTCKIEEKRDKNKQLYEKVHKSGVGKFDKLAFKMV